MYEWILYTVPVGCITIHRSFATVMRFDRVLTERNVYGLTMTETDL